MHLEVPLLVEIRGKDANYSVTVNGKFYVKDQGKMGRNFHGGKLES